MIVSGYRLTIERLVDGQRIVGQRIVKPERLGGELMAEGIAPGTLVRMAVEVIVTTGGPQ